VRGLCVYNFNTIARVCTEVSKEEDNGDGDLHYLYCNVDVQSVAKQRLGKQTSTIDRLFSVGSTPRPFLCNGSVNTFQK
jgi:hypothetical protein